MTLTDIQGILGHVKYKNWRIFAYQHKQIMYLQVDFIAKDETNIFTVQKGRKWLLSKHMTRSELVATAFKAILTAEEHEVRETFKYRGAAVFHPHYDVDTLVEISHNEDRRK